MKTSPRNPLLSERRSAHNVAFKKKLQQMALPLAPLVQLTTGQIHPAYPGTLLNFWLLTDSQLEELATFYHQRTPNIYTFHYPCPINWDSNLPLEEKRRKIGRFIGLKGCETPTLLFPPRTEDEIMADARRARISDEEELWRRKLQYY
ncbi:hypothetical protein F4808DRAFT_461221 [Astrocystis sublimbata]|nr:hypothetical protein F4808DRAFT_461221 [Astrocystis sublimbata]